jgi:hypothetical protein
MNYTNAFQVIMFCLFTITQLCTAMEKPETSITILKLSDTFNHHQITKLIHSKKSIQTLFQGYVFTNGYIQELHTLVPKNILERYTEYDSIEPLLRSNIIPLQQQEKLRPQFTQKENTSYLLIINKKRNQSTIEYNMFFTIKNQ